jgi:Fic family protein
VWNWQRPEWPNFSWNPDILHDAEKEFRRVSYVFAETFNALGANDRELLVVEILSAEAVATSKIENEYPDGANVQCAIRSQLGLHADQPRMKPSERGVAHMMVDLYRSFGEPLSAEMLFAWHRTLMGGRNDLRQVGQYRTHEEPMQVVGGTVNIPRVHFEAPPSADVPREMDRFIEWFNQTAPDGKSRLPALTRAGIAHFYFESIHPFEDGNGRIGRVLASKSLAQNLGFLPLAALSQTILAKRKAYYEVLSRDQAGTELTPWLRWFAEVAIESQKHTEKFVDFFLDKRNLLDRLEGRLNERQQKALLRVLRQGPPDFKGEGLTADNYMAITGASSTDATRDLVDMIAKRALTRSGHKRQARYRPYISYGHIAPIVIDDRGNIILKGRTYKPQMGTATPDFQMPPMTADAVEPATAEVLRSLVRGHVLELLGAIDETKLSAEKEKQIHPIMEHYNAGEVIGLLRTLRMLFSRAGDLGIELHEIGLEGIDPDDFF